MFKADRHELALLIGGGSLGAYPIRTNRCGRPDDHNARCQIELLVDDLIERRADPYAVIPPNRPSQADKRISQCLRSEGVLASVANEDVTHRAPSPPRQP